MLRVRPSTVLTLLVPCALGCASDAASKSEVRTLQASVKQLQDEMRPIVDDLSRERQRASEHVAAIGERRGRGSATKTPG